MRRWLPPLMIVLCAIAGGVGGFLLGGHWYDNPPPPPGVTQVEVGGVVPDFSLPGADGRPQALSQWRGRLVVLNWWASWCPPCIEEMPMLDGWAQEHADRVVVVGIAEDDHEAARAFLQQHPVGYPVLLGGQGLEGSSMQLGNSRNVLPYTVLVGRDGRLLGRHAGLLSRDLLDAWLAEHGR